MTYSQSLGAAATFLAVCAYGVVHSVLAAPTIKSWSKSTFGRWHDRFYRLFFNIVGGLSFIPVLLVAAFNDSLVLYRIPAPWLWLTTSLQIAAIVALLLGVMQTGASEFLGISQLLGQANKSSPLVRNGLYRWVRHPLYTAGLVFIWASPVMTSNLLALNAGITLYLYVGSIFEEKKLVAEHGDAYRRYQENVPRLIPVPWKHAQGQSSANPRKP